MQLQNQAADQGDRHEDLAEDGHNLAAGPVTLAGIIRTVLPLMEQTGVATAADVGVETLQQRLSDEVAAAGAVLAHPMLLSAWGTINRA